MMYANALEDVTIIARLATSIKYAKKLHNGVSRSQPVTAPMHEIMPIQTIIVITEKHSIAATSSISRPH